MMQRAVFATQDAFPGAAAKAAAVASLQGAGKAGRLAALLRSQLFMRRYEEDLAGRSQRLGQLARHWWGLLGSYCCTGFACWCSTGR